MRGRDRAALALVAVALAFATLAIGGAPRWAACTASLLGIASAVPYLTSRRTASQISPLLWPLLVAAGLTALQLIPLPASIAAHVAPAKLALVSDNAAAWGDPAPSWVVASYDPPATLVELAKLCGYLALAWTCVRLSSNRRARHWLATSVAGTATLVAIVTLIHVATGAHLLYGLYRPSMTPTVLGPFINVNHLSALVAMAVPLTIGLAFTASSLPARGSWLIATVALTATTLLTASRGGLVGLIAGIVLVAVILIVQRRSGTDASDRRLNLTIAVPAVIITLCTIILLSALTAGDVARDVRTTSLQELSDQHSKYQVWNDATDLVTENRWLGVGRGGFETTFTRLSPGGLNYAHAEDDYIQAVIDWGLPGAALLFLAAVSAARVAASRWRHGPLEAGALAGLVGLAIHDIADFSAEMPGVAMMAIALAAVLMPAKLGTASLAGARLPAAPPIAIARRAGVLALGVAIAVLAFTPIGRAGREEPTATTTAAARASWARHPSDYILAVRAAERLFDERDARAIKVVERALELNPRHGAAHQLAGRMLAMSQEPRQSAVEFAEAIRWSQDVRPVIGDVLLVFPDPETAANALPTDPVVVERVYAALVSHDAIAYAYTQRVAAANPTDIGSQELLAQLAIEKGHGDLALAAARSAWDLHASAFHATLVGKAMVLSADTSGAIDFMSHALDTIPPAPVAERVGLLFALSDAHLANGHPDLAAQVLERAGNLAEGNRELAIQVHMRAADVDERMGDRNQAAWERNQAQQLGATN